jgi:hypothetical protein
VEAEEVFVKGALRDLRLRVQERRPAAASHAALREGLLRQRQLRPVLLRLRPYRRRTHAAAPSGPTEAASRIEHMSESRRRAVRGGRI